MSILDMCGRFGTSLRIEAMISLDRVFFPWRTDTDTPAPLFIQNSQG